MCKIQIDNDRTGPFIVLSGWHFSSMEYCFSFLLSLSVSLPSFLFRLSRFCLLFQSHVLDITLSSRIQRAFRSLVNRTLYLWLSNYTLKSHLSISHSIRRTFWCVSIPAIEYLVLAAKLVDNKCFIERLSNICDKIFCIQNL